MLHKAFITTACGGLSIVLQCSYKKHSINNKNTRNMDKALTYSVVERKDPQNPDVEGRYYAQAQARVKQA